MSPMSPVLQKEEVEKEVERERRRRRVWLVDGVISERVRGHESGQRQQQETGGQGGQGQGNSREHERTISFR